MVGPEGFALLAAVLGAGQAFAFIRQARSPPLKRQFPVPGSQFPVVSYERLAAGLLSWSFYLMTFFDRENGKCDPMWLSGRGMRKKDF